MKFLALLIFCFLSFSSCGKDSDSYHYEDPYTNEDRDNGASFRCVPKKVNRYIYRCENEEVICYLGRRGGIFCKFKDKENE